MSPSDKLYAFALMLVGLGALAALAHWDNIAERFFPEHSGGLGACTGDPFGDLTSGHFVPTDEPSQDEIAETRRKKEDLRQ
jgi:hypothetical protein